MLIGTFCAIITGGVMPVFAILWGEMTDVFNQGGDVMQNKAKDLMIIFIYIGVGAFLAGWGMFACWMISG